MKKQSVILIYASVVLGWLQYASIGYLAPTLAQVLFPQANPHWLALISWTLIISSCLVPACGALIFGYLADRYGRCRIYPVTILLLGGASLVIGLLPNYTHIGIIAAMLFLFFHLIQSLSFGGQIDASGVLALEQKSQNNQIQRINWGWFAAGLGLAAGGLFTHLVSHQQLLQWGWRLPFLLGALSVVTAYRLKSLLSETEAFRKYQNIPRINPIKVLLQNYKSSLLKAMLLCGFIVINLGICSFYYYHFLIEHMDLTQSRTLWITGFAIGWLLLLLPIMARAADQIGNTTMILIGLIGIAINAPTLYLLSSSTSLTIVAFIQVFFAIFTASACAPIFKIILNLFPTQIRYTAVMLSWALSLSLFGRSLYRFADYLIQYFNDPYAPAFYASAAAVIAFLLILAQHLNRTYHITDDSRNLRKERI